MSGKQLLDGKIAAGAGNSTSITESSTFQAFLTGSSGALAAVVDIEVSNDDAHYVQGASITLAVASWSTAADDDTDGFFADELSGWAFVRARVVSISGTGAAVSVFIGTQSNRKINY